MTLLWYLCIFFIYFSFVKLKITNINITNIISTRSSDRLEIDNSTRKLPHVTILGALINNEHIKILQNTSIDSNKDLNISSQSFILNSNPLLTMLDLCEIGNTSNAKIIIAGHMIDDNNDDDDLTLNAISYVSNFYHIPLITITSRENILSDKALHDFIIRLAPPYLYEADAWFSIIQKLKYTKVVLIYSQEEESRMVASRFQMLTDDSDIQIERIEEYTLNTNFTSLILNLTTEDRLLAHIDELLLAIVRLQKLENFVWIINERALKSNNSAFFDGLLAVKLNDSFNEENLLIDATQLIRNTFIKFLNYTPLFWSENMSVIDCLSTEPWIYGKDVYKTLVNTSVKHGKTGNIEFNEEGDRIESLYNIINIQFGQQKIVGFYRSNTSTCNTSRMCREIIGKTELKLNEEEIIWPNGLNRKPDGIRTRRNVSVVTIAEKPFIFLRPGNNCELSSEVYCPHKKLNGSTDEEYEPYCCYGYCIDLLQELSKNLSFFYTLHLVADGKYGSFEKEGDDKHKRWDGMIGELLNYQADMIVAPLTMNPERVEAIEFTKPYKYQGITILVRKDTNKSHLKSFLQPFKNGLWIMVLLSVHIIAVVLYLLDRLSPYGRFHFVQQHERNPIKKKNTKGDKLSLSHALWFTWGILLNSGISEGVPKSFSARVLGMVWAGFAMIIVASYTANLAAFLVLDRPAASISGINDARLRNPQDNFTYATVKGSAVDMYFKRQVELSTTYRIMESKNYLSVEQAISELRDGDLNAFIWDSPRLEYEAAQDCNLITAGELFGRSSYGIGLRKKDPWINPLSHAILSLHETGFMELLDYQWIYSNNDKQCSDRSSSPATLEFRNMLDVFLLVAGGVIVGFFVLILEIIFKRQKERIQRENEISQKVMVYWKKKVDRRNQQRSTMFESDNYEQQILHSNSYFPLSSKRINNHVSSNIC
ncbi:unnamed protein product [Rotaria sordida]|uniref:Glutamate receptor n=2 Tax=Rotaria sordida TaxID=392033 RepID=A0A813U7D3_9BILA|nr:unnamed protein product [Rotaria sordida]